MPHRTTAQPPVLASTARLGVTRLAVRDLDRSCAFYEHSLGLVPLTRAGSTVGIGAGRDVVLELVEEPDARPAGRHGGLFHVALLYPSREELARVGQRLLANGTRVDGASDHGTHEAFYLADPDGNGLELAADRPRAQWPEPEEEYGRGPQPLDVRGLMDLVEGHPVEPHAAPGVQVGHLHLHVGDVDEALAFYRDVVGFELRARLPTAAFVSLGGYHHHLGMNVWKGQGVPPAPADAVGLRFWTVQVPRREDVSELADRLRVAGIEHEEEDGLVVVADPWNSVLRVEVAAD